MSSPRPLSATLALLLLVASAAPAAPPATLRWDAGRLEHLRTAAGGETGDGRALRDSIVAPAEAALQRGPFTLVRKTRLPASGDVHDYFSAGPYWWPNPDTADGLPYVRRDGETNRDNDGDRRELGALIANVRRLALGYRATGDERYAAHAARLVRICFLDIDTRMNPNLAHAQAVPGRSDGRPTGLIDTWQLPDLLDSVSLISESSSWTAEDQAGLVAWFSAFLDWFLQSDAGRAEAAAENNHGSWYFAQIAAYAAFTDRPEAVRALLSGPAPTLLLAQIAGDGSQPLELSRTRPLHYSAFNLTAWLDVATLAPRLGTDAFAPGTPAAESLHRAVLYLRDHTTEPAAWTHPETGPLPLASLRPVFLRAAAMFGDDSLVDAARHLPPTADNAGWLDLVFTAGSPEPSP